MLPPTLSGRTRLVPILAHPVDHVRAPRTYNPAFAAAGLDWCMVAMGVRPEDLAATLAQLARMSNLQGVNLTIPHKAMAHGLCRWLAPEARRTGAVNTMRLEADGSWAGESADGIGFVGAAQAHGLLDETRPVVIVGAGGAGRAIAFSLAGAGVRTIDVLDIEAGRADALRQALQQAFPKLDAGTRHDGLRRAGLVVQATPMGLSAGDPLPFDPALLAADAALFDIIAARDTELMAAAAARGLRVLGGRPMVEHQVACQLAFWRGDHFPLERNA
jgi:shikimate dehydrogenase